MSRRSFIKPGALASGGLVLGFFLPGANKFARAADGGAIRARTPSCASRRTTPSP
jgi:isoquinoline 1-oxidoreductase beta subunit